MARKNDRRRRLERKDRPKLRIEPAPHDWGSGAELSPEERSRVLSRFAGMSHRGTAVGFKPLLESGWVEARTPGELESATTEKLGGRGGPLN